MSLTREMLTHQFPNRKRQIHQLLRALEDCRMSEDQKEIFCRKESGVVTDVFWERFGKVYAADGATGVAVFVREVARLRLGSSGRSSSLSLLLSARRLFERFGRLVSTIWS